MKYSATALLMIGLTALAGPLAAAELEIRFAPHETLHAFEAEAQRGLSHALLQNTALINHGQQPVTLERVSFDVLRGEEVVLTRSLFASDLAKAAARGQRLEQAGLLQAYAFHFRPDALLGKGVKLAASPELLPNTALLIGHQMLGLSGQADRVRVRAEGKNAAGAVSAEASLALNFSGSKNEFDFPIAGRSFVAASATLHSHHRWAIPEEFALDIVRLGEGGGSYKGNGTQNADYFVYGAEVLAAADGKVVAVQNDQGEPESVLRQPGEDQAAYLGRVQQHQMALLAQGMGAIMGNVVVLEHASGEHSVYAHLKPGSVKVQVGDTVKRGQVIAQVGNSGNSTEPHLHFHVTNGADPMGTDGVPPRFRNVNLPWAEAPRQLQTGDIVETSP